MKTGGAIYSFKTVWRSSKGYIIWTVLRHTYTEAYWAFLSLYMTRYILVCIEEGRPFDKLLRYALLMCSGHILAHLISAYHDYFKRKTSPGIYEDIFTKVMDVSSSMEYKRFEQPDFYDKFTRALDAAVTHVFKLIDTCSILAGAFLSVAIAVIFVAGVDPVLLIFPVIPAVTVLILSPRQSKMWYDLDMEETRDNRVIGYTKRVFYEKKYAGELRLFGIKNILLANHKKSVLNKISVEKKYRKKITLFETLTRVSFKIMCSVMPMIYIALFVRANSGIMLGAYIAASILALESVAWRVNWSLWLVTDVRKEGKFVKNLRDFLEYKPDTKLKPKHNLGEGIIPGKLGSFEVNNVSFTYEGGEKPTLNGLSLSVKRGEKIALVGHNGAGKTTLVKLLMGLYETTSGEIKANGININSYEAKAYRSRFGTVFQDFQVFALSIAENVLCRKPSGEAERRLVTDSLKMAQFGDVLESLPDGIDTLVSREFDSDGFVPSGGQSQKLAIARVFAKNPDIVILDEPSSALDPIAEYNMYENMMKLSQNKAVIFISHRLSSARLADTIYMLENGSVIEKGTHSQLMERGGQYAGMFNLQAENYRESLTVETEAVLSGK